jgi:lipid-A-disaccharide synthase
LADEFIVPEVRGKISPEDVARVATGLLDSPERRAEIQTRLKEVVGEPGASARLAEMIMEVLQERFGDTWRA